MNDEELGRELSALTPEPPADYWILIDAMLAGVEAERRADPGSTGGPTIAGVSSLGEDSQPENHTDTDDNVVRLTDMNEQRDLLNRFNRRGGLILVAAASIVVLLAVAGLRVLRDDSTNIDAANDDSVSLTTSPPDDGTGVSGTDSNGDIGIAPDAEDDSTSTTTATAGADGSGSTAPIAATYCFYQNDTELYPGEQAVRLIVRTDGTAVAIERDQRPDGQAFVTESTGFMLDEAERTFAMMTDLGGQVYTRIWRISDGGLSTDIESFVTNGDCDAVDQALDGLAMPQPVIPEPASMDTALEPGTYCWQGEDVIRGFYQLTVGDGGTASVEAYSTIESDSPVIAMIETGTGTFASANEIVFNVERWSPEGRTRDSIVYTINGDQLQPTIYPSLMAAPVDCDVLDEWRLPTEGLNILTDEELAFPPGVTRATAQGGFVRGELAVYRVEAEQGQTMAVTISSLEDNAAVTVYNPESLAILDNEDGSGSRTVVLPEPGVYRIVLSSIRGNVDYTLDVELR